MSSERILETQIGDSGDIWQMNLDVDLTSLNPQQNQKHEVAFNGPMFPNHNVTTNETSNITYGEMLLQRFDDINTITDLTNSLHKGVEHGMGCTNTHYELKSKLNGNHNSTSKEFQNTLFETASISKSIYPLDVYGRVTLFEGKLVVQLRHFNINTNYPVNVGECWLCREKMKSGSHIHSHKHVLQGLFQVNNDFIQMDIDHYIIPEQALESHADVRNVSATSVFEKKSQSNESIAKPQMECSDQLREDYTLQEYSDVSLIQLTSRHQPNNTLKLHTNNLDSCSNPTVDNIKSSSLTPLIQNVSEPSLLSSNLFNLATSSKDKCNNDSCLDSSAIEPSIYNNTAPSHTDLTTQYSDYAQNIDKKLQSNLSHNYFEQPPNSYYPYQQGQYNTMKASNESSLCITYQTLNNVKDKNCTEVSELNKRPEIGAKKRKSKAQKKLSNIKMRDENIDQIPIEKISQSDLPNSGFATETKKCNSVNFIEPSSLQSDSNKSNLKSVYNSNNCKSTTSFLPSSVNMVDSSIKREKYKIKKKVNCDKRGKMRKSRGVCVNCQICRLEFSNLVTFKSHLQQHELSPSFVFLCCKCSKSFSHIDKFISHLETHFSNRVSCKLCSTTFINKHKLQRHLQTIHSEKKREFKCQICTKMFMRMDSLNEHMKIHVGKKHQCDICKKFYSSPYNRDVHRKNHIITDRTHVCDLCGKSYNRKKLLLAHVAYIHERKKFKCNICFRLFSRIDVLQRHRVQHDDIKITYDCEICGKKYSRKDRLKAHSANHQYPMKNKCPECPAAFSRKETLQKHINIHKTKEQCNICYKFLPSSVRLQKHMRWHETQLKPKFEKEYLSNNKCNVCSKSFQSNYILHRHMLRTHYKSEEAKPKGVEREKKFFCDICSKGFTRSCNLRAHLKTHNKGSEDEEILADLPTVLNATRSNNVMKKMIPCSNLNESNNMSPCFQVDPQVPTSNLFRDATTNSNNLNDGFAPIYSSTYGPHFNQNLAADLSSTSSFRNSSPNSPLNLSTEAITAAAYLLAHPFYEGPYQ